MSAVDRDGVSLVRFTQEDIDAAVRKSKLDDELTNMMPAQDDFNQTFASEPPLPPPMAEAAINMDLRDHFAGLAMQMRIRGMISCSVHPDRRPSIFAEWARDSYDMADAMLKVRDEP